MLGSDLKTASLGLITDANRHNLVAVDTKRAAIFDNDATALATSQSEHDLVAYLQCITSGCRSAHHGT